jgi:hypothetical protein
VAGHYSDVRQNELKRVNELRERCKNFSLSAVDTKEIIDNQCHIDYFYRIEKQFTKVEYEGKKTFT